MKHVAVLGLGDFGAAVARQLQQNKVSVFAADISRARVEQLKEEIEHVVVADFTQAAALEKMALREADAVVLATSSPMHTSILGVLRLKELGIERIIAKAENEDHAKVLAALGVSQIIIPEEDTAIRLANKISWTHVIEMVELTSGYSIMEIKAPPAVVGKKLRHSGLRDVYHVEVLGIREQPGAPLEAIPSPDRVIEDTCTLVVFGHDDRLAELRKAAEQS